jgi:hypothetical protein
MTADAKQKIELYLSRLRKRLPGISEQEVGDIVKELRTHILEKVESGGEASAADVDAVLTALGSPEELANEYLTDNLLARAEASRSPWDVLGSFTRWASLSYAGFFVLVGSLIGYFFGIVFILVAILKPFHPQTAGLWLLPNGAGDYEISLRLGFGSIPSAGREVLGWWIVPLGLLVGCAVVTLNTRSALWSARVYRRSHLLPRG